MMCLTCKVVLRVTCPTKADRSGSCNVVQNRDNDDCSFGASLVSLLKIAGMGTGHSLCVGEIVIGRAEKIKIFSGATHNSRTTTTDNFFSLLIPVNKDFVSCFNWKFPNPVNTIDQFSRYSISHFFAC